MIEQLNIFDVVEDELKLGDTVRIITKPQIDFKTAGVLDIEDYYYLEEFTGLIGKVVRVINDKKTVCC